MEFADSRDLSQFSKANILKEMFVQVVPGPSMATGALTSFCGRDQELASATRPAIAVMKRLSLSRLEEPSSRLWCARRRFNPAVRLCKLRYETGSYLPKVFPALRSLEMLFPECRACGSQIPVRRTLRRCGLRLR